MYYGLSPQTIHPPAQPLIVVSPLFPNNQSRINFYIGFDSSAVGIGQFDLTHQTPPFPINIHFPDSAPVAIVGDP